MVSLENIYLISFEICNKISVYLPLLILQALVRNDKIFNNVFLLSVNLFNRKTLLCLRKEI